MLQAHTGQDEQDSAEGQAEEPLVLAEVPCPAGSRLDFCWGLGSQLHVCSVQDPSQRQHPQTEPGSAAVIHWGTPNPAERRIAYDTLPKYKQLRIQQQAEAAESDGGVQDTWRTTLEYSRAISSILAADDTGEAAAASTAPEAEVMRERAAWELLTAFFVDSGRTQGIMTEDLVQWLQRNHRVLSTHPLQPILTAIRCSALPEEHPRYWAALQRCAALGWTDEAMELLGLHSAWARWQHNSQRAQVQPQIDVLEPASLLLRKMPRFRREDGTDLTGRGFDHLPEYMHYRRGWQGQGRALMAAREHWAGCEAASPATAAGVRQLLGVLAGLEAAVLPAADNWVELLVAQMLHCYPTIRPQGELVALMQRCMQLKGEDAQLLPPLNALPDFIQAAADADAQGVMVVASAMCSPWFMAHIPDILAAHPAGGSAMRRLLAPHLGGDQVEFYTLEYASHLMAHRTTWQVAAEYLAWCPVHGEAAMKVLLQGVPLGPANQKLALQALHVARQHGLTDTAASIGRTVGLAHWKAGRMGEALWWLLAAGDEAGATAVIRPVLRQVQAALMAPSSSGASPEDLAHLEGLLTSPARAGGGDAASGTDDAGSDTRRGALGLLQAYLRLQKALAQVQAVNSTAASPSAEQVAAAYAAARAAVMLMVRQGTAPPHLWVPILFQSIPLLEAEPPTFTLEQTHLLLSKLQAVIMNQVQMVGLPPEGANEIVPTALTQLQAVRLALARNLARAHVTED